MVLLIHHPVSPFSRKVRIAMGEKKMLFVLREEEPWNLSADMYKLNPAGSLPVFLSDGNVIAGNYAICEYLEEFNREIPLLPQDLKHAPQCGGWSRGLPTSFIKKFTAILPMRKFINVSVPDWLLIRGF